MRELDWAIQRAANTSPGEDGVTARMVKALNPTQRQSLLDLCNRSWTTGIVPTQWKSGQIKLIPKPDRDLTDLANWRPLCLTAVLGKILERMVNRRMMWFCETYSLFLPEQHGFRWQHSTQDSLAELSGTIRHALQAGDTVATLHILVKNFEVFGRVLLRCWGCSHSEFSVKTF